MTDKLKDMQELLSTTKSNYLIWSEYANCNGEYEESTVEVSWATERPVYKHTSKDR